MDCQESYLLLQLFDGGEVGQVLRTHGRTLLIAHFPDPAFQGCILSFQLSYRFQIVSKAVVQELHGLFLMTVDSFPVPGTVIQTGAAAKAAHQIAGDAANAESGLATSALASRLAAVGFRASMMAGVVRRDGSRICNPRAVLGWS